MSWGFVYVLWNESMPGLYKIGRTSRSPSARAEELSGATGVPTPFMVAFHAESHDHEQLELDIHEHFSNCRVNGGREFFALDSLREAIAFLALRSYSLCLVSEEAMLVSGEMLSSEEFNLQAFVYGVRKANIVGNRMLRAVSK